MKYVTSPIYYVNDVPHIGHAYTTILCDMFKKYQYLKGDECLLLTGTDEHGQKIENAAKAQNKSTQEYADEISFKFHNLWNHFNIAYDTFVRTTDDYHDVGVKHAFMLMFQNGDIYKGQYEGNYCVSCEAFFTKRQLVDNLFCPDCGKETAPIKEESYFFRLSKYEKWLLEWYKNNPNVILPLHKRNEVIRFVESGLSDLSITRSGFKWGISLPSTLNDDKHIIYVWLDALLSYITPLGYGNENPNKMYFFNDATHFVGKDILRFHAVYWPAFLMSLKLPLPKHIYAHGWWTVDGVKMSKSIGNVVNPKDVADTYGLEVMRYFLIREVPFGQDGDFSNRALIERANAELSDTLGNLLNRLLGMSEKYFNFNIESSNFDYLSSEMSSLKSIIDSLDSHMENMMPNRYLEELWKIFDIANMSITKYAPWEMMKQNDTQNVNTLLVFIANILAKGALLMYPILPDTSKKIMRSLGISFGCCEKLIVKNEFLESFTLTRIPPLFPKIELETKYDSVMESNAESKQDSTMESKKIELESNEIPQQFESKKQDSINSIESIFSKIDLTIETKQDSVESNKDEIDIALFNKLDIRVGKVIEAINVKDSTKLLMLKIDFGVLGVRQIISGIAKFYKPSDLQDVFVCAIINLKPSKIMGFLSEGMVLTSQDSKGNLALITPNTQEVGSKVS